LALILNIETSSRVCSVCLAKDGKILGYAEGLEGNEHAGKLTLFVSEIMQKAQMPYAQLDAVAVSAGPGSYTGLRIGTSVAKGLCYALSKPLLAVPTLMALAAGIQMKSPNSSAVYMPVMDAGRMDVYTALYNASGNELSPAAMVTVNAELELALSNYNMIVIGGNAVQKFKGIILEANFRIIENVGCDARAMAGIAEQKYVAGNFEDTAYFQPFYLHEFQPKLKGGQQKLLN
jgi:tRNA threonylcarbamoyladenosine biosynthesis protein TsaB